MSLKGIRTGEKSPTNSMFRVKPRSTHHLRGAMKNDNMYVPNHPDALHTERFF